MEGEGRFDKQSSANFTQSERQQFKGKKGSKGTVGRCSVPLHSQGGTLSYKGATYPTAPPPPHSQRTRCQGRDTHAMDVATVEHSMRAGHVQSSSPLSPLYILYFRNSRNAICV